MSIGGAHFLSGASTVAFENARQSVRRFVNAQKVEEIIFTKEGQKPSILWPRV